ncbi:hypothetical protein [Pantoea sp. 1.19]|uniref:hypothetical protein n=1 Tax=Pantoea sp. 1.19 TaxID=1925589 RepID=UPI0009F862C6|nr:hypothetical protein [Pantoea sp. 1.19]
MTIHDASKKKKDDKKQDDDSVRKLTTGEVALARTVFGNRIDYEKVKIHHGSCLPFGLQGESVAMTPNGEIYFRDWYRDDGNDSNLLIVFYVQIMPDDFIMQLHRF